MWKKLYDIFIKYELRKYNSNQNASLLLGNILFETFFSGIVRSSSCVNTEYDEYPLPGRDDWSGVQDKHTGASGHQASLEYFATVTARGASNSMDQFVHRRALSETPLFVISKDLLEKIYIQDKIEEDRTNKRKRQNM